MPDEKSNSNEAAGGSANSGSAGKADSAAADSGSAGKVGGGTATGMATALTVSGPITAGNGPFSTTMVRGARNS